MAKMRKKKLATVLHSHDEGCGIYICASPEIAWSVAGRIVQENLDEFQNSFIVTGDSPGGTEATSFLAEGVQCAKLLLEGKYPEAVQMYVERVADKSENIEVDEQPQIETKRTKLDKKHLRQFIEEGETELSLKKANGKPIPATEGGDLQHA